MKLKKEYQDKLDSLESQATKELIKKILEKDFVLNISVSDAFFLTTVLTDESFSLLLLFDMFEK